jgi:hypothetical protein
MESLIGTRIDHFLLFASSIQETGKIHPFHGEVPAPPSALHTSLHLDNALHLILATAAFVCLSSYLNPVLRQRHSFLQSMLLCIIERAASSESASPMCLWASSLRSTGVAS